jgi:hypothetical protein
MAANINVYNTKGVNTINSELIKELIEIAPPIGKTNNSNS